VTLLQALAFGAEGFVLSGTGPRGGKPVEQTMTTRAQEAYASKRARKGKALEPKLRDPKLSLPKPAPEAA
jgi:topoisomerase-4 subunit A